MRVYYTPEHRSHAPRRQFSRLTAETSPHPETPDRADTIAAHLQRSSRFAFEEPRAVTVEEITRLHAPLLVEFLSEAGNRDAADPADELIADCFALPLRGRPPGQLRPRAGYFCTDAQTPITPSTWRAARGAAGCALSAAERVAAGEQAAYALCRPPGHHAGHDYYGGYCYLNNAALAASALAMGGRAAVLDLDYHHGNGTQDLFYDSSRIQFVSLHADPASAYPFFYGYAEERGKGDGLGFTANFPLPRGTGDARYLSALSRALEAIDRAQPASLVVSFGYDTHREDPISHFDLTPDAYRAIGEQIAKLGLRTVVVQEGGYCISAGPPSVESLLLALC